MRFAIAFAVALIAIAPCAALADDNPAPWVADAALEKSVWSEVSSSGIRAVAPHVIDLEHALFGAKDAIALAGSGKDKRTVLTDGPTETLMALTAAAIDKDFHGQTVAIANPYPMIALILGSYYDEIGKPDDAVRVLDEGLATEFAMDDAELGEHMPILHSERGVALAGLHRWPESLASYDAALKSPNLDPKIHALLLRGRGYALTELNRLDEAEQAYEDSLKFDPDSQLAQHELGYIRGLKAGKTPTAPGGIKPLDQPPPPPPSGSQ